MATPFNPEEYQPQTSGVAPQLYQPVPPNPYAPQSYTPQVPAHQAHNPQLQAQPHASQPHAPQQWTPPAHNNYHQAPAEPAYHNDPPMAQAQTFAPPPSATGNTPEPAVEKKSFLKKLKRGKKEKAPAQAKEKTAKVKAEKAAVEHKTKTSPPIIFMFGMATGILCFLIGNMAMTGLLSDKTAQSFHEIERQNKMAQQPVLPGQKPTQTAEVIRGE